MIDPSLFSILLIFHILHGFSRSRFPSPILLTIVGLMKQSVAPKSTNPLMSAIVKLVLIEMGIHIDWNCIVTITEFH